MATSSRDHPRVCGEHHRHDDAGQILRGSSPRMRGTPVPLLHARLALRIIPAYAGNTRSPMRSVSRCRDHPRVCGEHPMLFDTFVTTVGSSPRMRGTLHDWPIQVVVDRIIPAYAGNTAVLTTEDFFFWDHPRVCGEHICGNVNGGSLRGSSPRMRGTLVSPFRESAFRGIIPAYAGNTSSGKARGSSARDHPRVCGEHEVTAGNSRTNVGSSPRMRGTLNVQQSAGRGVGIIPAYAGNT